MSGRTFDQAIAALDAIWERNLPRALDGDPAAARACQKVAETRAQLHGLRLDDAATR